MSRMYFNLLVLGVVILAIGFAATARADLLFSDNFDGAVPTATNDYGLNANLDTRQGGNNAGVGWVLGTMQGVTSSTLASAARVNYAGEYGIANALVMNNRGRVLQTVNINHSFTDAEITQDGGFTLRFDCQPAYTSSVGYMYSAYVTTIGVGGKKYQQSCFASNKSGNYDRSFALRPNGSTYVFKPHNTNWVGVYDSSRPTTTTAGFTCPIYTFELRVATTSITSGSGATGWLYAGSQGTPSSALSQADLKVGTPATSYVTWTWDSDNTNYIMFQFYSPSGTAVSNSALTIYNMIDNVSVWSGFKGTPEPSTLVLVGTGILGLLAYAWRRRRR